MNFEIYAVEANLGSLLTKVRFKVTETVGDIVRIKDDCSVVLEGRFEIDDPDLIGLCETMYRQAMGV